MVATPSPRLTHAIEHPLAPFRTFVLKIHSRCNLRCDYCYVYAMADQSWRSRPRAMTPATMEVVAHRIAEHAAAHDLERVAVVLHGGEPLLASPDVISYGVQAIRDALTGRRVDFSLQTNGVLLDENFINLFASLDVSVGLSIDGEAAIHDRHRLLPDGTASYSMAAAAATRLAAVPRLFSGILSVLHLASDPVRTYESLLEFAPPVIDFLLPHGSWFSPPPGLLAGKGSTPYADWLIQVFDRWYHAPTKETSVRLFDEIIGLVLGGSSGTEGIGLSPVTVAVIESDGSIERADQVKASYSRAGATGLNVTDHAFDLALLSPDGSARPTGIAALSAQCRECRVVSVCGGGLLAHRYRGGTSFDNPSVYCADLYRLVSYIRHRVTADITYAAGNDA